MVWTDGSGNEIGTGAQITVTPQEGGATFIASIPGLDCIQGDTVTLILETNPIELSISPDTAFICESEQLILTAQVMPDNGQTTITWYEGDVEIGMGTSIELGFEPGDHVIVAIADNGCFQDTALAFVSVLAAAEVLILPTDETLCEPGEITLMADAPIPGAIVWYDANGVEIGTGATLTVDLPTAGIYVFSADATEPSCIEGDTVTIKVLPEDLEITLMPFDTMICQGDTAIFTATVMPDWTMESITWFDQNFNALDTGMVFAVSPNAGTYIYYAIADNGCVSDTALATLTVLFTEIEINATPASICPGESTLLTVTGCDECSYTWIPDDSLDDPNSSTPTASPDVTTTYTVFAEGGCTVESLSVTVTVLSEEECLDPCRSDAFFVPTGFTPNNDSKNDVIKVMSEFMDEYTDFDLRIYNRWGQEVYHSKDKEGEWDGRFKGELLPPDVYGYYLRLRCPGGEELIEQGNITLLK